ncbi:MAG: FecR family protein [Smithella sp.]|jgi:hypothetical protein
MKKMITIISLTILILFFFTAAQAKPPVTVKMTKGQAQISVLTGKAGAVCDGQRAVRYLRTGDYVSVGCEVSTEADSRLEMALPDKSVVRFSEKTKFKLVQAEIKNDGRRAVGISLTIGKIWTNVRKALPGGGDKFEISCQNAVAGVRGTIYRMDVEGDQSALVKVYDGEVSVAGASQKQPSAVSAVGPPKPVAGPTAIEGPKPVSMEQWVYIVKSMQQIRVASDGKPQKPEDFTEASEQMDSWANWNKSRDKKAEAIQQR